MERMVSHHRLDVLFDAIDHHITLITASRCAIDTKSAPFARIRRIYDGSIYILQGQYPALEVLPLLQNPQSKKMCLIISCETTLNVDLDPFKWRPTTDTEDEPVQAEIPKKRRAC
jgi:hypothetical protein